MGSTIKSETPGIGRIIERQLRNWELARQQKAAPARQPGQQVAEFITISRAVGLPGNEISSLLNLRLGWPIFDREILQTMAGDKEYQKEVYEAMDERDLSWLEEFLSSMSLGHGGRDDYFNRLSETILALARNGNAIFLGRAADLILPRGVGLRVRLTASREHCIEAYAKEHGLNFEKAVREVEEIEHERARFIRYHFNIEASEQARHDLIINMEVFNAHQAADIIMTALRSRGIIA